jgi:hypothetical protein
MKKPIHCKKFNGTINNQCKAGCKYEQGIIDQCIGRTTIITCPYCEYPTPEEIAKKEAEHKENLDNMVKARKAITDRMRNETGCGRIKCPICESGTLSFFIAAENHHIHARCSTVGCVCWME